MKKNLILTAIAILCCGMISCSKDPQPGIETSVSISPSSDAVLNVGATLQLTVETAPEDATDKTVTWTTDAPSVVSVSPEGLVEALGKGRATVTATYGTSFATVTIVVEDWAEGWVQNSDVWGSTEQNYQVWQYCSSEELFDIHPLEEPLRSNEWMIVLTYDAEGVLQGRTLIFGSTVAEDIVAAVNAAFGSSSSIPALATETTVLCGLGLPGFEDFFEGKSISEIQAVLKNDVVEYVSQWIETLTLMADLPEGWSITGMYSAEYSVSTLEQVSGRAFKGDARNASFVFGTDGVVKSLSVEYKAGSASELTSLMKGCTDDFVSLVGDNLVEELGLTGFRLLWPGKTPIGKEKIDIADKAAAVIPFKGKTMTEIVTMGDPVDALVAANQQKSGRL